MAVTVDFSSSKVLQELQSLADFANKEFVLTSKGFEQDTFVLLMNFIAANPDNLSAKFCFESSRHLYKRYGRRASAYVKLLVFLYEKAQHYLKDRQYEEFLNEYSSSLHYDSYATSDYNELIALGYTPDVLDAILQADGHYLCIRKGDSQFGSSIKTQQAFEVSCTSKVPSLKDAKVFVTQAAPLIHVATLAAELATSSTPLVVVQEKPSKDLKKLQAQFKNLYVLDIHPDYLEKDFLDDLKSYLNQDFLSSDSRILIDALGQADVSSDGETVSFTSKFSYSRRLRVQLLKNKLLQESSPLVAQTIQHRLRNMAEIRTTLYVSASSETEKDYKVSKFASEVLEVSAIIRQGYITSIISELESYKNYPAELFTECYVKADTDLRHLLESVRVRQLRN